MSNLAPFLQTLQTQLPEEKRRRARSSLVAFAKHMVTGYDAAPHIIEQLAPALEWAISTPNARLIVTMPPRHSKSLHVSENLPAYFLGRYPWKRVIAASHTAELAHTFSRRVRNKIQDPRYPFDGVTIADDKGAVRAWDIQGTGGGYVSVGVGGSPTGLGGDLIIIDDPIRNAADAGSTTIREALWEWYQETLRTRLEPNGSIILTATRWHEDDLTGRLLNEMKNGGEEWVHLHLPAIDENDQPLWKNRWPMEALMRVRMAVGSYAWNAQYQGRPVPASGGILKRHWFPSFIQRPHRVNIIQSWDTGFETGTEHDYSVCSTIAYNAVDRWLLDVYREKLEFPDLDRMVDTQYYRWRPEAILIENAVSGRSLAQQKKRQRKPGQNIISIPVPTVKDWKIIRVNEMSPIIEAGHLYVPEAAEWLDTTMSELTRFPLDMHDDIVDSVMQGLQWIESHTGNMQGSWTASWLPDEDDDDMDRRPPWI